MNEMKSLTLNGKRYDSFPDQTARKNLKKKIPGPEGGAVVGQYLRVAEVDDDGNVTAVETVDAPEVDVVTDEQLAEAVANYLAENPVECGTGGISASAAALLIEILQNAVYTANMSGKIDALKEALASAGSSDSGGETVGDDITVSDGVMTIVSIGSEIIVSDGVMTIA